MKAKGLVGWCGYRRSVGGNVVSNMVVLTKNGVDGTSA